MQDRNHVYRGQARKHPKGERLLSSLKTVPELLARQESHSYSRQEVLARQRVSPRPYTVQSGPGTLPRTFTHTGCSKACRPTEPPPRAGSLARAIRPVPIYVGSSSDRSPPIERDGPPYYCHLVGHVVGDPRTRVGGGVNSPNASRERHLCRAP